MGEPLLQVAARAGVTIPTGCLMGSCHACEV
ncbi:MAG: 2Fe-2S iron-sulfur cluster-binding protein, partial [Nodosilinea sp.]